MFAVSVAQGNCRFLRQFDENDWLGVYTGFVPELEIPARYGHV
jgi:hypothetical protein